MKKILISLYSIFTVTVSLGQNEVSIDSSNFNTGLDLGISSRNIWRGLDYGSSPSIYGDFYGRFKNFSIGAMGTSALNGSKTQYGNWLELYASCKFKNLNFVVDDYFFFNSEDSLNNYFDFTARNTQHLIEARVEYENDFLEAMIGSVIYSNEADKTNGVYLEATYKTSKTISVTVGYLTSSQWLSFYNAGGITTLGINGHRKLKLLNQKIPVNTSLIFNPNYKNASPLVGNNPASFVISVDF